MSNIALSRANAPDSRSLPLAKFLETAAALAVFNSHRSMSCSENHSRRRLCTSARCCSSACAVFFKGDLVTVEETPQHRDRKALAAIGDQPLLDLEQRHVRAAPDQAQQIVAMRLDPAGASVAATRRRRNLARGLEPLHPAHCARYAHFKMRGRLIALTTRPRPPPQPRAREDRWKDPSPPPPFSQRE